MLIFATLRPCGEYLKHSGSAACEKNFGHFGHSRGIQKIRLASARKDKIKRFAESDPHILTLLGVRFCCGRFATAARRYFRFCEIIDLTPLPTRERTAAEWISVINRSPTFGNYIAYSEKAGHFRGQKTDWRTESAQKIAHALKLAGGGEFRPPNCTASSMALQIIHRKPLDSGFA